MHHVFNACSRLQSDYETDVFVAHAASTIIRGFESHPRIPKELIDPVHRGGSSDNYLQNEQPKYLTQCLFTRFLFRTSRCVCKIAVIIHLKHSKYLSIHDNMARVLFSNCALSISI